MTIDGVAWLFDCGEGTQHQIMRCGALRLSRIQRIFCTHLHGDHVLGLPGLMCTMGSGAPPDRPVLHLYGPPG